MKLNLKPMLKKAIKAIDKNSPQLLTALGVVGFGTTCILIARETPKVLTMIEEAKDENGDISKADMIITGAKGYWPAITTGGMSVACIVLSAVISKQRYAGLLTAYIASKTSLDEYKKSVVEALPEEGQKMVEDIHAKKQMKKDPETSENMVERRGAVKCYDSWSGRYIPVTYNELKGIENQLNKVMVHDGVVYLEEVYDYLGINSTKPSLRYGWSMERDGFVTVNPMTTFDDQMRPCYSLSFTPEPTYDP